MVEKVWITDENASMMLLDYDIDKPDYVAFDTETTGLNIVKDKAFLVIVGWETPIITRVFCFEPTKQTLAILYELFKMAKMTFAHNTKFDLHMLTNTGFNYDLEQVKWSDTMILARLCLYADDEKQSLALKSLAKRFVDKNAGDDEKIVKSELMAIKKRNRTLLDNILKEKHNMTLKQFEATCKDIEQGMDTLPLEVQETYYEWEKDFGEPTYAEVPRDIMIKYAYNDVIITLGLIKKCLPILKNRQQVKTFLRENACILVFYRQERIGFKIDTDYLEECKIRLRAYIQKQRAKFYEMAGRVVNIGQHAELKKLYMEKWGVNLPSVSRTELPFHTAQMPQEAKDFTNLLLELRSLEKWYSTYIMKFVRTITDGRIYTQIQQAGTVSGRISSDFQQFPKEGLYDNEGNELIHPRSLIIPSGGIYNKVYCCDYSAMELRGQAHYTLKLFGGDKNLCRAYVPFECYRIGEVAGDRYFFNIDNEYDREHFEEFTWYCMENDEQWHPTDLHAQTAINAFGEEIKNSPDFKKYRKYGKVCNFACNYGAGYAALRANAACKDLTDNQIMKLHGAYGKTFPKVKAYQDIVQNTVNKRGYVQNEFGRRYYIKNTRFAYKCANYLIQGTCADAVKEVQIKLDKLFKDNHYKSRIVISVHDELIFEIADGEEHIVKDILKIMADQQWSKIPFIAEPEMFTTRWSEKKEVEVK